MKKITVLMLCVLTAGFLSAQNNGKSIKETLATKKSIKSDDFLSDQFSASIQAPQKDSPRVLLLTSYVTDDYGEIMHCLKLNSTETISFWIEFTALAVTDVKFHFIWTGPEFYWHETDWYSVKYNDYYYLSVDTNTDWRKGTYKLIIIAEQSVKGSGSQAMTECNLKLY
jgi:hypothetical protein